MRLSAVGGPAARRWPHAAAVAASSSGATTSLTSPHSSAVAASTASPKNVICLARRSPMSRGSVYDEPPSRARPRLTNTSLNVARSVATTRSHAMASPSATPTATPSTAAIVGLGSRWSRPMISPDGAHLVEDELPAPAGEPALVVGPSSPRRP